MADVVARCSCGRIALIARGVHPGVANRVVCECTGCRDFAHRMGHAHILDAAGGTERVQVSPASLEVITGSGALGCIQQSPRGALRWHARCCGAPLVLTLPTTSVPFAALDVARIERPSTEILGPIRARVHRRCGSWRTRITDLRDLLGMLGHLAPLVLAWWWRADHRRSPLLDPETLQPTVEPERLYPPERLRPAGCR